MNLLSKVCYYKIHLLSTRIEIRSVLNVIGLCSDEKAEMKNKEDVFEVIDLLRNVNDKDFRKFENTGVIKRAMDELKEIEKKLKKLLEN